MAGKQDICQQAYNLAFQYESKLGSCPQCVLAALKETLNVGNESIFQAAQGLAGGTALSSQGTCGALAGGMIAICSLIGITYQEFTQGQKKNDLCLNIQNFCMMYSLRSTDLRSVVMFKKSFLDEVISS
jgi:hypothetical protein